jgi:hypothetical protein
MFTGYRVATKFRDKEFRDIALDMAAEKSYIKIGNACNRQEKRDDS